MSPIKILIVEDEMIIAEDMADALMNLGYEITGVVGSGNKAIEQAATTHPDIVLMDINLQGELDGVEAADEIRVNQEIPVIFLTAYADQQTIERAKATEPFAYLLKPFQDRELKTTIEIAIQRHQAERAIRELLQKESNLNQLKSQFLSMISHDLRLPLTTIQSTAELLEHKGTNCSEAQKIKYFEYIYSSIDQLTKMLDNILDLSKLELGKVEFEPLRMDLKRVCIDVLEQVQISDRHQHEFEFVIQGSNDPVILDEQLLRQCLLNLLSNACKYSPKNTKIEFSVHRQEHQVLFSIKDRGFGIPEPDKKNLFQSFQRASNVKHIPGTGLGLMIVKKCVDLHQGEITVDSELDAGTTFKIALPLQSKPQKL
jgi:signal transduction histidine kinase